MQGGGVSTGGGRDGSGMHYWAINNSAEVIDLGNAPFLGRESFFKMAIQLL